MHENEIGATVTARSGSFSVSPCLRVSVPVCFCAGQASGPIERREASPRGGFAKGSHCTASGGAARRRRLAREQPASDCYAMEVTAMAPSWRHGLP